MIPRQRASGAQVKALRLRQRVGARVMYQKEFAARLHATLLQVKRWEANGMPPVQWLLARITFDPKLRVRWCRWLQRT